MPFWQPCAHRQEHRDCKRCGRYFCPTCEGGSDDLHDLGGFAGAEVCDPCWLELDGLEVAHG